MRKEYNFMKIKQGSVLLTFDNEVYHVIDSKLVAKAGKQFKLVEVEHKVKLIKFNGRDIAFREKLGGVLYEK